MSGEMRWAMVTEPILDANERAYWQLPSAQRDEMCDLVSAHGFDPNDVAAVGYDVIDAPLLRISEYLTNDDGCRYLDETGDKAATQDHEVLLRAPLPAWWRPVFTEA